MIIVQTFNSNAQLNPQLVNDNNNLNLKNSTSILKSNINANNMFTVDIFQIDKMYIIQIINFIMLVVNIWFLFLLLIGSVIFLKILFVTLYFAKMDQERLKVIINLYNKNTVQEMHESFNNNIALEPNYYSVQNSRYAPCNYIDILKELFMRLQHCYKIFEELFKQEKLDNHLSTTILTQLNKKVTTLQLLIDNVKKLINNKKQEFFSNEDQTIKINQAINDKIKLLTHTDDYSHFMLLSLCDFEKLSSELDSLKIYAGNLSTKSRNDVEYYYQCYQQRRTKGYQERLNEEKDKYNNLIQYSDDQIKKCNANIQQLCERNNNNNNNITDYKSSINKYNSQITQSKAKLSDITKAQDLLDTEANTTNKDRINENLRNIFDIFDEKVPSSYINLENINYFKKNYLSQSDQKFTYKNLIHCLGFIESICHYDKHYNFSDIPDNIKYFLENSLRQMQLMLYQHEELSEIDSTRFEFIMKTSDNNDISNITNDQQWKYFSLIAIIVFFLWSIKSLFISIINGFISSWLSTKLYNKLLNKFFNVEISSFEVDGQKTIIPMLSYLVQIGEQQLLNKLLYNTIVYVPLIVNLLCNITFCLITETPISDNFKNLNALTITIVLSILSIVIGYAIKRLSFWNFQVKKIDFNYMKAIEEQFQTNLIGGTNSPDSKVVSQEEDFNVIEQKSYSTSLLVTTLVFLLYIINILNCLLIFGGHMIVNKLSSEEYGNTAYNLQIHNSIAGNYNELSLIFKFLINFLLCSRKDLKENINYHIMPSDGLKNKIIVWFLKLLDSILKFQTIDKFDSSALLSNSMIGNRILVWIIFIITIVSICSPYVVYKNSDNYYAIETMTHKMKEIDTQLQQIFTDLNKIPMYYPNPHAINISQSSIIECFGDLSNFALERFNDKGQKEKIKNFSDSVFIQLAGNNLVCGPTGAGKSVALKIFLNLFHKFLEDNKVFIKFLNSDGSEQVIDVKYLETESLMKKIINIPQSINLPKKLTALESMKLVMPNSNSRQILHYLTMVQFFPEIKDINRNIETFSGGQEKRLNIAMFVASILETEHKYVKTINNMLKTNSIETPNYQNNIQTALNDKELSNLVQPIYTNNNRIFQIFNIIENVSLYVSQSMYFLDEAYVGLDYKKRKNLNKIFFIYTKKLLSIKKYNFTKRINNICISSFLHQAGIPNNILSTIMNDFDSFYKFNILSGFSKQFYTNTVKVNDIDGDNFHVILITHLPKEILSDSININNIIYINKKHILCIRPTIKALYKLIGEKNRLVKKTNIAMDDTIIVRDFVKFKTKNNITNQCMVTNSSTLDNIDQELIQNAQIMP